MRLTKKAKAKPKSSGAPGKTEAPSQSYEDIIMDQRDRLQQAEIAIGTLEEALTSERSKSGDLLTQIAQNHAESNAWSERFAEALRNQNSAEVLGLREANRIMAVEIETLTKERDLLREGLRKTKLMKDQFG